MIPSRCLRARAVALLAAVALAAVVTLLAAERPALADGSPAACPDGMLAVPGGTFAMGAFSGFPDEAPPHPEAVAPFCLDATEVTVDAYSACARSGLCTPAHSRSEWSHLRSREAKEWSAMCNRDRADRRDHPVNCVSWFQATDYCSARGLRLPTEVEYEYAARGGDEDRLYVWGSEPPSASRVNACGPECAALFNRIRGGWHLLYSEDDGYVTTAPVGSFPLGDGRWGHHDLSGNVCEWVGGDYCPYTRPGCGEERVRVVRGNQFLGNRADKLRGARRNTDDPRHATPDSGFRCAADIGTERTALPPPPRLLLQAPEAPYPRVLLALAALAVVAGAALDAIGAAGGVILLGAAVSLASLEPALALSTALTVAALGCAMSRARRPREMARGASAVAFVAALGAGAVSDLVPYAIRFPLLVATLLALGILAIVRRGRPTARTWSLAALLGGALGASYWARPDPALTVVMGAAVVVGVLLRRRWPATSRADRLLGMVTALVLLALASFVFAREVLPTHVLPDL